MYNVCVVGGGGDAFMVVVVTVMVMMLDTCRDGSGRNCGNYEVVIDGYGRRWWCFMVVVVTVVVMVVPCSDGSFGRYNDSA